MSKERFFVHYHIDQPLNVLCENRRGEHVYFVRIHFVVSGKYNEQGNAIFDFAAFAPAAHAGMVLQPSQYKQMSIDADGWPFRPLDISVMLKLTNTFTEHAETVYNYFCKEVDFDTVTVYQKI